MIDSLNKLQPQIGRWSTGLVMKSGDVANLKENCGSKRVFDCRFQSRGL